LQAARAAPGQASIALDGKTLRGSFGRFRDRAAAQVLSTFATDIALVLAHVDVAHKSNEIPPVQTLLAKLGVGPGAIVTLDTLQCRKKLFEVATAADNTLIVQLEDNRPTLCQKVQKICATKVLIGTTTSRNKSRNRDECRIARIFDPATTLLDTDWRPHLAATIPVEREVFTRNSSTGMWHHFAETELNIASTPIAAARAAQAIRAQ